MKKNLILEERSMKLNREILKSGMITHFLNPSTLDVV